MITALRAIANFNKDLSSDQILFAFEEVGKLGDIMLLKNDGIRKEHKFTVIILFPYNQKDIVRVDDNNLSNAVKNALTEYLKHKS